ncbi:unnamed protein product [Oikopleura dioica]|uniref:PiggyBac transposable element-derived protein domain-containing protein n=1 Tax=Oikopleura dioica TaxID=34765 RepID=E4X1E5_OIKDI|nr:unnamed protein product [Oikopleura dioica]
MSDSEEFESSESEEEESDNEEFAEESSDEAEFLDEQEVRDSQNEVEARKVGRGSKARFADLQFVEVQQPADCAVFNPSFFPRPRQIPRQYFEDNYLLFEKVYGIELMEMILDATNTKMRARFPSENIFTMSEFRIAFGMLIFASVKRGVNDNFSDLFKDVLKSGTLDDYNLLSIRRFEFFRKCLDVGEDRYVLTPGDEHRHIDVREKIFPLFEYLNKIFTQYSDLNAEKGCAIDESMRSSFGHRDPTKRYNPSKPHRYGQQCQMLCSGDGLVLACIPDLDAKSKIYKSNPELTLRIIPKKLQNKGLPMTFDRGYTSRAVVEHLLKMKFRILGTCRIDRLQLFFGKGKVPDVFRVVPKKRGFERRMYVYRAPHSNIFLDIIAYFDKPDKPPVVVVTNCQDQLPLYSDLPHCSQVLLGRIKPAVILAYNARMGSIDTVDFCLNKWRLSFKSKNVTKSWTHFAKRQLTNFLDICLYNLYTLHKNSLVQTGATIKTRYRRQWQLQCAKDFLGKKNVPALPPVLQNIENIVRNSPSMTSKKHAPKLCSLCPSRRDGGKRSQFSCARCDKPVCLEHRVTHNTSYFCRACVTLIH